MSNSTNAKASKRKRHQIIKPFELVLIVAFVVIVVVLLKILTGNLATQHEVSQGTALSNEVVNAMDKQDTAAIVKLGTGPFRADHTATELNEKLTFKTTPPITFAQMFGKNGKRSIVDRATVNNKQGQHVIVLYRYDKLKAPMFVRIVTAKPPKDSQWYLMQLDVSPDESSLLNY